VPWPDEHDGTASITLVLGFDPENPNYSYHHGFSINFEGASLSRALPAQWQTMELLFHMFKERLDLEFQPPKEELWRLERTKEWRRREAADKAAREAENKAKAKAKREANKAAREAAEAGGLPAKLRKMSTGSKRR
jgi:hypothetical protein